MKFNIGIFGFKKPSGQIQLEHVISETIEDKDTLFSKAVKETAASSLTKDIRYELDCMVWGKDRVDQTLEAAKVYGSGKTPFEVKKLYPLAAYSSGYFVLPKDHWSLAEVLARKWVEENYNK